MITNAANDTGDTNPLVTRTGPTRFLVTSRLKGWKAHLTLLDGWESARGQCGTGPTESAGGPPPSGELADVAGFARGLTDQGGVEIMERSTMSPGTSPEQTSSSYPPTNRNFNFAGWSHRDAGTRASGPGKRRDGWSTSWRMAPVAGSPAARLRRTRRPPGSPDLTKLRERALPPERRTWTVSAPTVTTTVAF